MKVEAVPRVLFNWEDVEFVHIPEEDRLIINSTLSPIRLVQIGYELGKQERPRREIPIIGHVE